MVTVKVTTSFPPSSVEWKGKTYLPGEPIPDLSPEEIKRLKALGRIEIGKGEAAAGNANGADAELEKMTKGQICEKYGLDLDPAKATKEEIVAAARAKLAK